MNTHTRIATRSMVLIHEHGFAPVCAVQIAAEEISAPPSAHSLARRIVLAMVSKDVRSAR